MHGARLRRAGRRAADLGKLTLPSPFQFNLASQLLHDRVDVLPLVMRSALLGALHGTQEQSHVEHPNLSVDNLVPRTGGDAHKCPFTRSAQTLQAKNCVGLSSGRHHPVRARDIRPSGLRQVGFEDAAKLSGSTEFLAPRPACSGVGSRNPGNAG